jgi:hypothetical protein
MQDCQPYSFNVACSAADLFFQGHRSIREKLNGSAIRRSTDFLALLQQGCTTTNYASRSGTPPRLTTPSLPSAETSRAFAPYKSYANRPSYISRQHAHITLADQSFISLLFQISLRNTAWSEACSRLSSNPLVHFICKVPHSQPPDRYVLNSATLTINYSGNP